MSWRVATHGRAWAERKGEPNRQALRELVEGGRAHAVLAFAAERPVGWCCLGPRGDFPRIVASRTLTSPAEPGLWSVVCFFIPARRRGQGVGGLLLEGAVDLARSRGARVLEGYPATVGERPLPGAFAWTGVPRLFERAGFRPLPGREGRRAIYRLDLASAVPNL
jgi:GNAT superfamily N-acetyltransferase